MKRCPKCNTRKDLAEFNKSSARQDGVQSYCRPCQRQVDKDFYNRTPGRQGGVRKTTEAARLAARTYVLRYLNDHPCIDCGESDVVVLDFDHIGEKERNVSDMIRRGFSLTKIQAEIAKCEVRCANCHRRVTARRHGGWWRAQSGMV